MYSWVCGGKPDHKASSLYIYRGSLLTGGFLRNTPPHIPVALRQPGRLLRFPFSAQMSGGFPPLREPARHQDDGGMPQHANAITDSQNQSAIWFRSPFQNHGGTLPPRTGGNSFSKTGVGTSSGNGSQFSWFWRGRNRQTGLTSSYCRMIRQDGFPSGDLTLSIQKTSMRSHLALLT